MQEFKAEWSGTYGPEYRGIVHDMGEREPRLSMGKEWHEAECKKDKEYLKQPG